MSTRKPNYDLIKVRFDAWLMCDKDYRAAADMIDLNIKTLRDTIRKYSSIYDQDKREFIIKDDRFINTVAKLFAPSRTGYLALTGNLSR